jgi:putative transposase
MIWQVMRRIDEQYLAAPFYGSRRMVAVLWRDGWAVNRKRVRRLMRLMGLEAIYQKPDTSRRHPEHKVPLYLLRGLVIGRPNYVWIRFAAQARWPAGSCIWWR